MKVRYFTYHLYNPSNHAKYRLDQTGQLKAYLMSGVSVWNTLWTASEGVYRENSSSSCECLKGFEPFSMSYTRLNDRSGGCVRKSPLQSKNNTYGNGKKDWFLQISNRRLPISSKAYLALNASRCELT
jgi:hypothetical protein